MYIPRSTTESAKPFQLAWPLTVLPPMSRILHQTLTTQRVGHTHPFAQAFSSELAQRPLDHVVHSFELLYGELLRFRQVVTLSPTPRVSTVPLYPWQPTYVTSWQNSFSMFLIAAPCLLIHGVARSVLDTMPSIAHAGVSVRSVQMTVETTAMPRLR